MGRKEMFRKRNTILKINKKQEKKKLIQSKHYEKNTLNYKRPLLKIEQAFKKIEKAKHVDKLKTLIQQKVHVNKRFMQKYSECVFQTKQKCHDSPEDLISEGDLYSEYVSTNENTNVWYLPEPSALCFKLEERLESLRKRNIEETTGHLKASMKTSYANYLTLSLKEHIQQDLRNSQKEFATNVSSDKIHNIEAACSFSTLPGVKRSALLDLINANQTMLVGSSRDDVQAFTEVPLLLLEHLINTQAAPSICSDSPTRLPPRIVCSTPHFLTAQLGAKALGKQLKDADHSLVELDVGFRKKRCPDNLPPLLFVTNHQLVCHILAHPSLPEVSHVILDRAQHRDDMFDLILTYLRQHLLPVRPDLKLIILSSPFTMDILAKHFRLPTIKLSRPARHPNPVNYLETILKDTNFTPRNSNECGNMKIVESNFYKDYHEKLEKHVNLLRLKGSHHADLISNILNPELEGLHVGLLICLLTQLVRSEGGCILVFLPNDQTIGQLYEALGTSEAFPSDTCVILKYHSKITKKDSVYKKRLKESKTVVILATDCIEVLDSIQGVRHIVDCGCYEKDDFLAHFNLDTRQIEWVTRQIADERKSWCEKRSVTKFYRVYTSVRGTHLRGCGSSYLGRIRPDYLTYLVKRLGIGDVNGFLDYLDIKPQHRSIHLSIKRFQALAIMDSNERLTPMGYALSSLPLPPHLAKMLILGCVFSCLDPVLSIVAVLLHHDPFDTTLVKNVSSLKQKLSGSGCLSDHLVWVRALAWFENLAAAEPSKQSLVTLCQSAGLLHETLDLLLRVKGHLLNQLARAGYTRSERSNDVGINVNAACVGLLASIVYAAFYPNVAVIRSTKKIVISKLVEVTVHPSSVYHETAQASSHDNFLAYSHCYGTDMGSGREQIYIQDVSPVCSIAVILFSHDLHVPFSSGRRHKFSLRDGAFQFRCTHESMVSFLEALRFGVNQVIEKTTINCSYVDWSSNSPDVNILRCAVALIENKYLECKVTTLEREDMTQLKDNSAKEDLNRTKKRKKPNKRLKETNHLHFPNSAH